MQQQPKLFIFFGLIASGKSTLAQAWAERHGINYYNSDVVRKELAGFSPSSSQKEAVDQGIYSKEFSQKTYSALLEHAEKDIEEGKAVVLDASYQSRFERDRVCELAKKLNVPAFFILCECPEEVMKQRMETRSLDPNAVSDGRWEIYLQQKKRFEFPDELAPSQFFTINTDMPVNDALDKLENLLKG